MIQLGSASAKPGTIQYGRWDAFDHPTGNTEFLPVIIAMGHDPGPCLWLSAGIHGPEHAGPWVIYKLLTQELVDQMRGTIIAIPALSPAGLRTKAYQPYHISTNPNRLWPDGKPKGKPEPDKHPPTSLEVAYEKLFVNIANTADYLIDYHNAWTNSLSFVFRDRVLYRLDDNQEANRTEAEKLAALQEEMILAYGHTSVTEFQAEKCIKDKLHRSTSGAALLVGRIPAFTAELGTGHMPDPDIVAASAAGTRNVMRWAGMLNGEPEAIEGIKVVNPGFRVRRSLDVRAPLACVALPLVEPGDRIKKGDPLFETRDIWGRPVGDQVIRSQKDGIILGRSHGIFYYPGNTVLHLAIRDESPIVSPYPKDFFTDEKNSSPEAAKPR